MHTNVISDKFCSLELQAILSHFGIIVLINDHSMIQKDFLEIKVIKAGYKERCSNAGL